MNCHNTFIFFVSSVILAGIAFCDKSCDLNSLRTCHAHEECTQRDDSSQSSGVCKCARGYSRQHDGSCLLDTPGTHSNDDGSNGDHIPPSSAGHNQGVSGSSIAAGIIVPLVLIATVVSLYYTSQRYKWLQSLRQWRARNYDQVRIGQEDDDDDPPIA